MIGSLDPSLQHVQIVGAGLTGATAAYRLRGLGYRVQLIDPQGVGGMLQTDQSPSGPVERAAHSLLGSPAVRRHLQDLGVPYEEVAVGSKARWIARGGRARRFPLGLLETLRTIARVGFHRSSLEDAQSTLEQWGQRHLGAAASRYLLAPMVRGIYGCALSDLQQDAAFPEWSVPVGTTLAQHLWRIRRQRARAPRLAQIAPCGGMGAWMTALRRALTQGPHAVDWVEGRRIESLGELEALSRSFHAGGTRNLLLCVPLGEARRLLQTDPAAHSLAQALEATHSASLISVTLFCPRREFTRPPRGVGILFPPGETPKSPAVLGVLFNSSAFRQRVRDEATVSLTAILGGTEAHEALHLTDEALRIQIFAVLRQYLGFRGETLEMHPARWERAIPLYDQALRKAWDLARTGWCALPGRILAGNYTGTLSLRAIIGASETFVPYTPSGLSH